MRLDRLSELGIFRFYERVLDLGAGLGGSARWLARRRGCAVISFGRDADEVAASRLLVRRAHLDGAVRVGVADFARLPVANGSFTHAWSVESLAAVTDKGSVMAELFRAVRPGGHVAVQEWTATRDRGDPRYPTSAELTAALAAAGFVDLRCESVADLAEAESAVGEIFRERLAEILGEPSATERAAFEAAAAANEVHDLAARDGRVTLVQLFARKPA